MLNRSRIRGLSLVEMMVGIAIALVLVAGAMGFYAGTLRGSVTSNNLVELNQTMRSIMGVIDYDLRRAGYSAGVSAGAGTNDFTVRSGGTASDIFVSTTSRNCVLYSYDFDQNKVFNVAEIFGFRRNPATGGIEALDPAAATKPASTDTGADCGTLNLAWLPMNVPTSVVVDALTFSTEGSQCIAFDPKAYDPAKNTTFVAWQLKPGTGSTVAACETTMSSGNRVPLGTTTAAVASIPANFTAMAEIRLVQVSLTAHHARDETLTRTLVQSVRVRNDRAITLP